MAGFREWVGVGATFAIAIGVTMSAGKRDRCWFLMAGDVATSPLVRERPRQKLDCPWLGINNRYDLTFVIIHICGAPLG